MASGDTALATLQQSQPSIIAGARIVREQVGQMPQLVDRQMLGSGVGETWNEISLDKLTAQSVTSDTQRHDNPQKIVDNILSVTPSGVVIEVLITDPTLDRISQNVASLIRTGQLMQNAIQRKKNIDGLTAIDGFTTQLGGAGQLLTSGLIRAARYRISSNTTEPGPPPYFGVFHGNSIKSLEDEMTAGVGTDVIPQGVSADVLEEGWTGRRISGVSIFENGDLTLDSGNDVKGGVFSRQSLVEVEANVMESEMERHPNIGVGATSFFLRDYYAYGERSSGNWGFEVFVAGDNPTS